MTPPLPPRPDRRALLAGALLATAASPALAAAVSAEAFGVRPDGGDQTEALQRALDAAAAAGRPLALAPGDYRTGTLAIPAGGGLVGPRAARLLRMGRGPLLAARGVPSARVAGLSLEGLGVGEEPLLAAAGVPDLVVEDVAAGGVEGRALALEGCGGRVVGCAIARAGVGLFSIDATGLLVAHNAVADCADNGVLVWRSSKGADGTQVLANRIARIGARSGGSGEFGNGVNVFRAGGVIVSDNVVEDCAFSAVRDNAGDGVQILGNQARRMGEVALFVEFGYEGAVVSGNVVDGAAHGIVATNFNEGGRLAVVSGNVVRALVRRPAPLDGRVGAAYGIFVEADAAVTGNVVEGSPDEGLRLGFGPYLRDVAATGNVIRDCGYGIAVSVVEGAGATLVASNLIARARGGAVVGRRWEEVTTGDLLLDPGRHPHLTLSGNVAA